MIYRSTFVYFILTFVLSLCSSCSDTVKTLIPHRSWTCGMPDGIPRPEKGVEVFEVRMQLDQIYDIGNTPYGQRQVLVVHDGKVTGARIQGSILPGSLDFQLILPNNIIEIEQLLVIRTNDGKYIYLRNAGTGINENDVRIVMDFEAPNDSVWAWLNTGKFISRRFVDLSDKILKITVYDVSDVEDRNDADNIATISKPTGIPYQPWDYRKATPSEKPGEQIISETVTLGPSSSIGISKRGIRNVIPITGGSLTGNITGKILAGGADYQNFSNPATLDARYLWQADNGEIIIVRNAGTFGALVPTFEARIDGKYAWLNAGKYLSSNPEMVNGGVSLKMYKSNGKEIK